MDKMYCLCHQATEALSKTFEDEDEDTLFVDMEEDEDLDFELHERIVSKAQRQAHP